MVLTLHACVRVCVRARACGWPERPPRFNKSIVCVSPDWEHIGPGSGPAGAGVQGLGQTGGPVLRGSLFWSFLFSPQKSCLLGGPRGAMGSLLRSVPPRDDPALPPSGGNLSPLLADSLPSLQGCNTRTADTPVTKQPHRVMKHTCAHAHTKKITYPSIVFIPGCGIHTCTPFCVPNC